MPLYYIRSLIYNVLIVTGVILYQWILPNIYQANRLGKIFLDVHFTIDNNGPEYSFAEENLLDKVNQYILK